MTLDQRLREHFESKAVGLDIAVPPPPAARGRAPWRGPALAVAAALLVLAVIGAAALLFTRIVDVEPVSPDLEELDPTFDGDPLEISPDQFDLGRRSPTVQLAVGDAAYVFTTDPDAGTRGIRWAEGSGWEEFAVNLDAAAAFPQHDGERFVLVEGLEDPPATIRTSDDGVDWTARPVPSRQPPPDTSFEYATWEAAPGNWFATPAGTFVLEANRAEHNVWLWLTDRLGDELPTLGIRSVEHPSGDGRYVWRDVDGNVVFSATVEEVGFDTSRPLVVSDVLVTRDGTEWARHRLPTETHVADIRATDDGRVFVLADAGGGVPEFEVWVSDDLETWTQGTGVTDYGPVQHVRIWGDLLVALTDLFEGGRVVATRDGLAWEALSPQLAPPGNDSVFPLGFSGGEAGLLVVLREFQAGGGVSVTLERDGYILVGDPGGGVVSLSTNRLVIAHYPLDDRTAEGLPRGMERRSDGIALTNPDTGETVLTITDEEWAQLDVPLALDRHVARVLFTQDGESWASTELGQLPAEVGGDGSVLVLGDRVMLAALPPEARRYGVFDRDEYVIVTGLVPDG